MGIYVRRMIIHASHQRHIYTSTRLAISQPRTHENFNTMYIYTSIIQVPWTPNQNREYNIKIITKQKNPNNFQVTKCSCNMRYLSNQTQQKLPYIQTYIYDLGCLRKKTEGVYIRHWLPKGRKIFNIWYFKMESAKNSW